MDNYDNIFQSICRVCLQQNISENMISLIDDQRDDGLSAYGKAVTTLSDVIINKDDTLPSKICEKCIYLLRQAIYFKLRCESSNQRLRKLIDINCNIKETLSQYALFTLYFPESDDKGNNSNSTLILDQDDQSNLNPSIQSKNEVSKNEQIEYETKDNFDDDNHSLDDSLEESVNENDFGDSSDEKILDKIEKLIQLDMTTSRTLMRKINKKLYKRGTRLQRQSPITDFTCNVCHKVLANKQTYSHHMQRHNGGCRYVCEECGKGFPIRVELEMHQVARHGSGPYLKCDHCPYKAPRKLDLVEHLRLHTGERPFACDQCGLTFRRRAIWKNHLVCHTEKKFECSQCLLKFYRHSQLLLHMDKVHERLYTYICDICGVTYAKTRTVRRHLAEKHGVARDKQGKITRVNKKITEFQDKPECN